MEKRKWFDGKKPQFGPNSGCLRNIHVTMSKLFECWCEGETWDGGQEAWDGDLAAICMGESVKASWVKSLRRKM